MALTLANGIAISGITLILNGTIFTLMGQVFENTESIVKRHLLLPGFNGDAMRSVIRQKRQTGFGLLFIMLGSIVQIISATTGFILNSKLTVSIWMILIIALIPWPIYIFVINRLIKKEGERAIAMGHEKLRK